VLDMKKTNYRPTRSQQLLLAGLVPKRSTDEIIVVHHVLEDSYIRLELQLERRLGNNITLERIVL